jgi:hypothetical protein
LSAQQRSAVRFADTSTGSIKIIATGREIAPPYAELWSEGYIGRVRFLPSFLSRVFSKANSGPAPSQQQDPLETLMTPSRIARVNKGFDVESYRDSVTNSHGLIRWPPLSAVISDIVTYGVPAALSETYGGESVIFFLSCPSSFSYAFR